MKHNDKEWRKFAEHQVEHLIEVHQQNLYQNLLIGRLVYALVQVEHEPYWECECEVCVIWKTAKALLGETDGTL